jgi:FAD/FMN-containing dehydrogenase
MLSSVIEPIFRRHGGRPHWGKLHTLGAPDLAELYPQFRDFQDLQRELDPNGRMLNPHLRHILGVSSHA